MNIKEHINSILPKLVDGLKLPLEQSKNLAITQFLESILDFYMTDDRFDTSTFCKDSPVIIKAITDNVDISKYDVENYPIFFSDELTVQFVQVIQAPNNNELANIGAKLNSLIGWSPNSSDIKSFSEKKEINSNSHQGTFPPMDELVIVFNPDLGVYVAAKLVEFDYEGDKTNENPLGIFENYSVGGDFRLHMLDTEWKRSRAVDNPITTDFVTASI